MQFCSVEQIERSAMADHDVGEEIAPGVVIERRQVLRVGLSMGLLLMLGSPASARTSQQVRTGGVAGAGLGTAAGEAEETRDLVSVDDLVRQLRPKARDLITTQTPDEEAYLRAVSSLLSRVRPERPWNSRRVGRDWEMDTTAYFPPIVLFQIRMKPGAVIDLHDHRHYNGVLLATEGSTRARHFDIVRKDGDGWDVAAGRVPPEGGGFKIRRTADRVMTPGMLSTLSRDRDNIHHIEAGPEGCQLLDFFTHFRPEARSFELEYDVEQLAAGREELDVSWKPSGRG